MGKNWLISSPRTFLALGPKQYFVYKSRLDFKKKKKINIPEYSEIQKWKKIEKANLESISKLLNIFKNLMNVF